MRRGKGSLREAIVAAATITPSGALSPGPLSASAVAAGIGLGVVGGLLVALGHLIVEVPYIVLIAKLYAAVEERMKKLAPLLNGVAAAFTLYFAYLVGMDGYRLLARGFTPSGAEAVSSPIAALAAGIVLTGANAYFLAWWLTVGKPIVDGMRSLPPGAAALVYTTHYAYDLVWLSLLAYMGGALGTGGAKVLGAVLIVLSLVLLYFAVRLGAGALRGWRS